MIIRYKVYGHGRGAGVIPGEFPSRVAAVKAAKAKLLGGTAVRFLDGSTGIYPTRGDARRDSTGEHASYTVDILLREV